MSTVNFIIAGWIGLGMLGIWFLVCLFVVVNMQYRDENTWHARFILFPREILADILDWSATPCLPRNKCSYFRAMFLWTFATWLVIIVILVLGLFTMVITAIWRFFVHWTIYPLFTGKYVKVGHELGNPILKTLSRGAAVQAYMASLITLEKEKRYTVEGKIPFTRIPPIIWISLSALLYETAVHWHEVSETTISMTASVPGFLIQVLPIIAAFVLFFLVVRNWKKIKTAIEHLHDKVCWELPDPPDDASK